ncbi:helix-turn-helix domain-containing protein [Streptosporangium sp. NPDC006007]|uniref:helix-turn-helix domain-containing protein n=1 Tax=Streptosporangium sp. NPDC006007 TaxID=3154575 RepID=UPI0033A0940E
MPGRPQMVLTDRAELIRLIDARFTSAVDLAATSGVNRQTIGWLRGGHRSSTSRRSADALARALGVPTAALFRPWHGDDSSPSTTEPLLLKIGEVADALRCGETHVYRLIAAGELDTTDVATPGSSKSKSRVPRESLHAYVRRQTRSAPRPNRSPASTP